MNRQTAVVAAEACIADLEARARQHDQQGNLAREAAAAIRAAYRVGPLGPVGPAAAHPVIKPKPDGRRAQSVTTAIDASIVLALQEFEGPQSRQQLVDRISSNGRPSAHTIGRRCDALWAAGKIAKVGAGRGLRWALVVPGAVVDAEVTDAIDDADRAPAAAPVIEEDADAPHCVHCDDGQIMSDTCDACDERHCAHCEPCDDDEPEAAPAPKPAKAAARKPAGPQAPDAPSIDLDATRNELAVKVLAALEGRRDGLKFGQVQARCGGAASRSLLHPLLASLAAERRIVKADADGKTTYRLPRPDEDWPTAPPVRSIPVAVVTLAEVRAALLQQFGTGASYSEAELARAIAQKLSAASRAQISEALRDLERDQLIDRLPFGSMTRYRRRAA